jgi:MFS family permease
MLNEASDSHEKRNFALNIIEGALWVAGASMISATTVLPSLVSRLGGGNIAVGAVGVILWVGLFLPQIFASRYGQTFIWKKPWVIGWGITQRLVVLAIGIALFFLSVPYPQFTLWLLLILYSLNQIALGITTPVWFDFYAKLIPLRLRGRITGIRNALAGTLAFASGAILTWLLSNFSFPENYALVFFISFIFQATAILFQSRIIEDTPSKTLPFQSMREYGKQLRQVVKTNLLFRNFLIASSFTILGTMPLAFYTVYALNTFHADESIVGQFTLTIIAGHIISAPMLGYLADHFGNKLTLICTASSLLLASLVALAAPSLSWFYLVFVCIGINAGTEVMIRYNLAIEYGPLEQRSTYIGLTNTILSPLYFCGLLGGWISNTVGYHTLFILGALCSLVGISLLVYKVQEPRTIISSEIPEIQVQ